MKKLKYLVAISLFLLCSKVSYAQRFGYIDSEFILSKMPAYAHAQSEVEKLSQGWQKEMEGMHAELEKLQKSYQAEEILLTSDMKVKRQEEITRKENELREFQRKTFGFEGSLFKRRQEMIRPVQDQLFEAVEKVVRKRGLNFMFDKSGDVVMLYTDPRHDYTEFVLEELGLTTPEMSIPGERPAGALVDDPADIPPIPAGGNDTNSKPATPGRKPAPVKKKNN
ncbi:OmpH family outer membrane protein [Rufibacter quisquiliarum]|uniref:Outer membrane protein n=1 Tax=Rufibacter quisquiliarum TaxID=1549639 RepID=A0A839GVB7_9BACT|nr:OmpH family outer membrane protein [Rufibacter quisquiliarum]MBA9077721.1 outer membrane protein [Rufibacter quisquiliarum]